MTSLWFWPKYRLSFYLLQYFCPFVLNPKSLNFFVCLSSRCCCFLCLPSLLCVDDLWNNNYLIILFILLLFILNLFAATYKTNNGLISTTIQLQCRLCGMKMLLILPYLIFVIFSPQVQVTMIGSPKNGNIRAFLPNVASRRYALLEKDHHKCP